MNCTQCGAVIRDDSGFCDQCGARIDQMLEQVEEIATEEKEITTTQSLDTTTTIHIKEELIQEAEEKLKREQALKQAEIERIVMLEKQAELQRLESAQDKIVEKRQEKKSRNRKAQAEDFSMRKAAKRRYRQIDEGPTSIFGVAKLLVRNPLLSIDELESYIDDGQAVKSILLLILAGAIMTAINFNVVIGKLVSGLVGLFGNYLLLMGSSYMGISDSAGLVEDILEMPFVQDSGLKIILYPILSHLILISLMSLFIIGIFKIIKKEDVAWIDCVRLMLTPLSILLIGKMGVFLLSFISGTLAAYFYVLMMFAVVVITILQFVNFLGKSALIIYSMPLIYLISALIRNGIILQIIKMSMARYALYF